MRVLSEFDGIAWASSARIREQDARWSSYGEKTTYTITNGTLTFGSGDWPRDHGIPIVNLTEFLIMLGFGSEESEDCDVDFSGLI